MLIQYFRLPVGDKEHIQFSKNMLKAMEYTPCLNIHELPDGAPKTAVPQGGVKLPNFPLGEPVGCVVAIPFTDYDVDTSLVVGFRIGWALYNKTLEPKGYSKADNLKIAIGRAFYSTVTTPEKGHANFPHSLTDLIELMIGRAKAYYKTDNIINYV